MSINEQALGKVTSQLPQSIQSGSPFKVGTFSLIRPPGMPEPGTGRGIIRTGSQLPDYVDARFIVHDLQSKLQEATRMVASVQAQIQTRDREKKLSVLTNKELSSLAPETVTYKSVGKMYVVVVVVFSNMGGPTFRTRSQVAEHAYDTSNIQKMDKDMAALDKKRIYWERNKTEAQGNLQELIKQIQQHQGA
ncbi:hypothetical protein CPC16_009362 [Podila verticillata]|nr:hypothetical protein CPC16_009362 [Podila verticillata]